MVNKNDHCESTQLQSLQPLSHTRATLPMQTIDPSLMQRSDTKNWEATLLQRPNCFGISQILCETAHAASNHHQKTHRNWVLMYILHLFTIYNWITKKSPPHSKNLQLQHPSLPRHQRSLASLASFAQSLLLGSHFRPWCSGV